MEGYKCVNERLYICVCVCMCVCVYTSPCAHELVPVSLGNDVASSQTQKQI